jgi:hypothetical protein
MFETCIEIRNHFSDYVDGLCTQEARKAIRYHLSFCEVCRERLEQWQAVQQELHSLRRRQVPPELALRLRVQMSQLLNTKPLASLRVRLSNALKPLLIPAFGGVVVAVICFCLIMGQHVVPMTGEPDVTVQLVQPARVQTLAPMDFSTGDHDIVLEIPINAAGRVKGYRLVSGQGSPEVMQRLDRMVYFSIFKPATMFGKPTDGQVILSLRRITVRG